MKSKTGSLLFVFTLLIFIILASAGCNTAKVPEPHYWPTDGWQTATPEAAGIDSEKLAEGLNAISDNGTHIHSFILMRTDSFLLYSYFYP